VINNGDNIQCPRHHLNQLLNNTTTTDILLRLINNTNR